MLAAFELSQLLHLEYSNIQSLMFYVQQGEFKYMLRRAGTMSFVVYPAVYLFLKLWSVKPSNNEQKVPPRTNPIYKFWGEIWWKNGPHFLCSNCIKWDTTCENNPSFFTTKLRRTKKDLQKTVAALSVRSEHHLRSSEYYSSSKIGFVFEVEKYKIRFFDPLLLRRHLLQYTRQLQLNTSI